jgi:hypothetical protein
MLSIIFIFQIIWYKIKTFLQDCIYIIRFLYNKNDNYKYFDLMVKECCVLFRPYIEYNRYIDYKLLFNRSNVNFYLEINSDNKIITLNYLKYLKNDFITNTNHWEWFNWSDLELIQMRNLANILPNNSTDKEYFIKCWMKTNYNKYLLYSEFCNNFEFINNLRCPNYYLLLLTGKTEEEFFKWCVITKKFDLFKFI